MGDKIKTDKSINDYENVDSPYTKYVQYFTNLSKDQEVL